MDVFVNDDPRERLAGFDEAAARLGMSSVIVEKDFWVCWTLQQLFAASSVRQHLIFKGGTSLSKAFGAISRFSEDIDLSLDRGLLGFVGEKDPAAHSGKAQKALLAELEGAAADFIGGPLLAELQALFAARLKQHHSVERDPEDPQTLLFSYPRVAGADGYVKPVVRMEFGARGVLLPAEEKRVIPDLERAIPGILSDPEVAVIVLGVERTFWEKATILHMLAHRDPGKPLPDRMSRHYYDMAMLSRHPARALALSDLALLDEVAHHKSIWFRAAWANYETAKPGSLRLSPGPELEKALRRDYAGMREMLIGDVPGFDEILAEIAALEREINATG